MRLVVSESRPARRRRSYSNTNCHALIASESQACEDLFFRKLREQDGFVVTTLPQEEVHKDFQGQGIHVMLIAKEEAAATATDCCC